METVDLKHAAVTAALATLKESLMLLKGSNLTSHLHDAFRDSVIKRFEYSMDTFCKYLRKYLEREHGIMFSKFSINATFRECLNVRLIDLVEFDLLLAMMHDTNSGTHVHNEELARGISNRVYTYYDLMNTLVEKTKNTF